MRLPDYSISYAIPYLILLFFLFIMYGYEQNKSPNKSIVLSLVGIVLLWFIGLRGHIQTDFINYYPLFERMPSIYNSGFLNLKDELIEPGYLLYSIIIKSICPSYYFFVFVNTLIDLIVLFWFFRKYSNSVVLSFIIFLIYFGLVIEFNLFRNAKSIMLFLLSVPYIRERKFLPFFALNLVGISFHISALIFIPLYFILNLKINKVLLWGIFIICNIFYWTGTSVTESLINIVLNTYGPETQSTLGKLVWYYINGEEVAQSSFFGYMERLITYSLVVCCYDKLYEKSHANRIFCNSYVLYYLANFLFGDVQVIAGRLILLFIFSYWVLIPNLLSLMKGRNKKIITIILLLVCVYKTYSTYHCMPYKYENLTFGVESYEERKYHTLNWLSRG